jgi:hypothetical protein
MLPDPEVLVKYGKLAASAMRALREKAKTKGKEHKQGIRDRYGVDMSNLF